MQELLLGLLLIYFEHCSLKESDLILFFQLDDCSLGADLIENQTSGGRYIPTFSPEHDSHHPKKSYFWAWRTPTSFKPYSLCIAPHGN